MKHTKLHTNTFLKSLFGFIKSSLVEINPSQNIKLLHTNIRADILAGITVAIIALPLALAFGEISQLGPVAGIWGAIAGGIIGGIFGGCMVGVSGPTAPKAAQISAFLGAFVISTTKQPDLIAAFSIIFLSGLILVFISILKISHFIHYTPYPVVAGFMCGIGAIVILTQINAFVGLETEKSIYAVFENFQNTFNNINIEALYVSIPSLLLLFLWKQLENIINFLKKIPPPLAALILGSSIANLLDLNIPYIGDKMGNSIENNIFSFYIPDFYRLGEFIGPAFALAGLAVLDSLLSCKVADNLTGTRHSSDRETFGQGMANMFAGLLGGVTTATATMRTVANIKFGGKTPLASIVHGVTLLAILLGLGSLVAAIPTACLAAILFKVGIDILDYRILPILKKLPIMDLLVFIIVFSVTIIEDLMIAIAIGIIITIIYSFKEIYLTIKLDYRHILIPSSKSDLFSTKENKQLNNLSIQILQPQGPLFFGSIEPLLNTYSKAPKHKVLIVNMKDVTMIDLSGTFALEDLINNAKIKNIKVYLINAKKHVKNTLEKLNFIKYLGTKNYIDNNKSIFIEILEN